MQSAIAIQNLNKSFAIGKTSIQAIDNLTIAVQSGCTTGIVGPDGAGKTTLMRLIMGLLLPDAGEISIFGKNVAKSAGYAQEIAGYMPQRFGLYEDLTVLENMELYGDLKGLDSADRQGRYDLLFHMSGLKPYVNRMAGKLSGGMKQKLGLICTLLSKPRLLILDEPTVGVDPLSRRELWAIIADAVQHGGMTVLLSTAYLDEAQRCQNVIILNEGRLVASGKPADFLSSIAKNTFLAKKTFQNIPKQCLSPSEVSSQGTVKPDCKEGLTLANRALASQLEGLPEVIDSSLSSSGVRVILKDKALLPEDINLQPIAPRFEDAFVRLLADRRISQVKKRLLNQTNTALQTGGDDVIVVKGLEKRFGDFIAVNKVSFTVKRGEVFGLLGANGAGKSTTFRMLCGLLPATGGFLEVAGENLLTAPSKARAKIGYMAQRFSLYANLTALQNLQFFAGVYGLSGAKKKERISWALEEFSLSQFQNLTAADLSLGYKQRLALAAALMHEPAILFLDEPTSGVDPLARREFWSEINWLASQGVTVLVTTHFMEEAEYCDRLVIMSRGELLILGSPDELKSQYGAASMEELFIKLLEQREGR